MSLLLLGATSVCVYRSTLEESRASPDCHRAGRPRNGGEHHTLARPTTPRNSLLRRGVLPGAQRSREQNQATTELPPGAARYSRSLWVNLHGGFFVGIVLLITYAIGAAAEELFHGTRRECVASSAKVSVDRWGVCDCKPRKPLWIPLACPRCPVSRVIVLFQRISEFQSVDFHSFTAAYFETLLVLAIAAAVWHLGKGRLVHALLLLSWSHLALFSARNIPIFAVVSAPGIGLAMREWLEFVRFALAPRHWPGKLIASLAELEAGLRMIANSHNRRSWHLAPCFGVLVLALSSHPSRSSEKFSP